MHKENIGIRSRFLRKMQMSLILLDTVITIKKTFTYTTSAIIIPDKPIFVFFMKGKNVFL